ncbi:MAG: primosomal protein N', partial [Cyclobacteriaceae bacterium]|nr:primosomal protein N' [Cyclobacteriaceae bacterium]
YHARDSAIVLGRIHHAKVILGSATPSLESYYNATMDKYELVSLDSRYGEAVLPEFSIVDMKEARRKRKIQEDFSYELIEAIQNTLSNKEQAIIFKNRRGYSPILQCDLCAWVPKCPNCSVSLTYHQYKKSLNCHYCGYNNPLPHSCGACNSTKIKTVGSGTEKLEETLQLILPEASIARMDLETTRSKSSYEKIISNFESGKINILVGTQMVSKGLDFDHVNLVGVVDLDQMLHFPDFRSYERTYQLVTQVSGRAGRRKKQGVVYIQTSNPDFQIIESITNNDFLSFYHHELFQRKQYFYPPFSRLIKITIKDRDKNKSQNCALELANKIRNRKINGVKLLGPEKPSIDKIRNYYLNDILIKINRQQSHLQKIKHHLKDIAEHLNNLKEFKSCYIVFDVDVQ